MIYYRLPFPFPRFWPPGLALYGLALIFLCRVALAWLSTPDGQRHLIWAYAVGAAFVLGTLGWLAVRLARLVARVR